jgi:hypothetical protein
LSGGVSAAHVRGSRARLPPKAPAHPKNWRRLSPEADRTAEEEKKCFMAIGDARRGAE